jgi:hypothetical protein
LDAELLQLPPALCDNQLAHGLSKGVSARATQMRLIVFGVGYPIEDLLGENVVAELPGFWADLVEEGGGEKHWLDQYC